MTPSQALLAAALSALTLSQSALAVEAVAQPLHNPFKRPVPAGFARAAQDAAATPHVEASPPRLELKAIVLAGPNTVVKINQQFLSIGELIEGYRLVSVQGTRAVLVKDGKELTLDMEN